MRLKAVEAAMDECNRLGRKSKFSRICSMKAAEAEDLAPAEAAALNSLKSMKKEKD